VAVRASPLLDDDVSAALDAGLRGSSLAFILWGRRKVIKFKLPPPFRRAFAQGG